MSFPNFSLANIKCFTVATTYAFQKISVCKFCDLYSKYACPRHAPAPNFHLLSKNCLPYPNTYAYFPAASNRWAAAANWFASFGVGFQFFFLTFGRRRPQRQCCHWSNWCLSHSKVPGSHTGGVAVCGKKFFLLFSCILRAMNFHKAPSEKVVDK